MNRSAPTQTPESEHHPEICHSGVPRKYVIQDVIVFLLHLHKTSSVKLRLGMARCFRRIWKMRDLPYVKMTELSNVAEKYWINAECIACSNEIQYALSSYSKVFAEMSTGPVTPRSLKHLCRCTIRRSLKRDGQNILEIGKLNLPPILKSYLRLEF